MTDSSVLEPIGAALQADDLGASERLCRARLEQVPDDSDVLLLLGLTLQRQGRLKEAVGWYRRLTELHPDSGMHWGNYATALRVAGDPEGAVDALKTTVELAPDDSDPLEQLGLIQLEMGQPAEARDTLIRAWAKAPESPRVRIHAAGACVACRDSRAEMLLKPWRDWGQLDDDLQADLADMLTQVSDVRAAVVVLEELLQRSPTHLRAQLLAAKSYERINLPDEAEAMLDRIVTSGAADDPEVRREITRQRVQLAARRRAYSVAHALLEQLGEDDAADYGHYFSLARVCDKRGDAAAATAALEIAHARQVEEVRSYAPHLLEPEAPPLPHANDRVYESDYRAWPALRAPDASQSPVFVVGFPRSGTTLLEQMLDAHPSLQSMDERPFFNQLANQLDDIEVEVPRDLGKLDQRDCDELRKGYLLMSCGKVNRQWDVRLVDKNPLNMLWLPMIHRMYPQAQFILAVRHPCDVILSCYLQNFRAAPLAIASQSLESLARAYVAAMEQWLYHVALIGPDVLVSRYEDMVADARGGTRRIAEFLGLENAEPMLRFDARAREKGFIATPSYTQVIEPVNARSIGHWQQYREYFEPTLPILRPMLTRWGYSTQPVDTTVGA